MRNPTYRVWEWRFSEMRNTNLGVFGNAPRDKEIAERLDHIGGFKFACDTDRQAFPGELVDDV